MGPARTLPSRMATGFQRHADRKGLENLEEGLRPSWANITSASIPSPVFDERRRPSSLDIDSTRQALLCLRNRVYGQYITSRQGDRREVDGSTKARSTTPSLWEYSLLRLNSWSIRPLKWSRTREAHQDAEAGTVDVLLKVKEKGKN